MEPYPKRPRLYVPLSRQFPQSFDHHHAYYDEPPDTELENEFEEELEEKEVEEEEEEEEIVSDPDAELQQKRARLDYKLKSTFEAIFEKYEQDFDGVGDEIDLETGDIVVDNGHLLEMQNERDAGDTSRARNLMRGYTEEPDDTDDIPSSSLEETDILDIEDYEEEIMSDEEEMMEDDMILRGFARANRFMQASPELGPSTATLLSRRDPRQAAVPRPGMRGDPLPSETDILAQFGPQLGPQIVDFVSQRQIPDDSHIEPAWRAPELPNFAPVKRPTVKRAFLAPQVERSLSPEAVESVWAPVRARGRRRMDGADSDAIFRGESLMPIQKRKSQALDPLRRRPIADFGLPAQIPPKGKRSYQRFTAEDDQILLDWVAKGRARGLALSSQSIWEGLEAKHPNHTAPSWMSRYQRCFTYLPTSQTDGSEGSDSDTSVGAHILEEHKSSKARAGVPSQVPVLSPARERPTRIRKPAQRDSRIISWSEAVDTIQSLDPVLHAEMLEDTRKMKADDLAFDYPSSSRNPGNSFSANRPRINESREACSQSRNPGNDLGNAVNHHSGSMAVDASPLPEESTVRAPCPHADCRPYSNITYRLQRLDSEDLSEMCLHLFRVHHTTPFPCGELNCKRKGEEGYFMQADLVKHVRIAHPNIGALQRLRGRVDADLLERSTEFARPPQNMNIIPPSGRQISQPRDSDFMSPSKCYNSRVMSSSQPFSSSSNHDRTPRRTGMPASTSTPMTSVSSLKVNRSSATTAAMREVSESHESLALEEQAGEGINMSSWTSQIPREKLNPVVTSKSRTPAFQEPLVQGPPLSRNVSGRDILPTPLASTWDSPGHGNDGQFCHHEKPEFVSNDEPDANAEVQLPRHPSSSATRTTSGPNSSPSHKTSKPQSSLDETPRSSLVELRKKAPLKRVSASQAFSRNTVDPSYEFSDEELGIDPIPKQLPSKEAPIIASLSVVKNASTKTPAKTQSATKPLLVPSATKSSTKVPPAIVHQIAKPSNKTPANQRKSRLQHIESDYDELSLGADDFVFMFSQPRSEVQISSTVQIKEEDTTDTPQKISSVPARKRKLSTFRAGSDDELCVIGPSPPSLPSLSTISKPKIKVEGDDVVLSQPQPTKAKARTRKSSDKHPEASASSQPKPQGRQTSKSQPSSTNTPLLALTPSRNKASNPNEMEILDSAAESSPPELVSSPNHSRNRTRAQREAAGSSSPLIGLLTPVRRKHWSGDPLKGEQVTVVVKTPGGTLRRCGEDGFECGRSFCFRCRERREGDGG